MEPDMMTQAEFDTMADAACYLPGWDDGPDGALCERENNHDGQHGAFEGDDDYEEKWDVTWVMDDEDFPFGN